MAWCANFTIKHWTDSSDFHFQSSLLTSEQWPSLEADGHQDRAFQVDAHSVPNAPVGVIGRVYQERVKGLGQTGVFLQIDAKSSTKTCLEAEGSPPLES